MMIVTDRIIHNIIWPHPDIIYKAPIIMWLKHALETIVALKYYTQDIYYLALKEVSDFLSKLVCDL